MTDAAAVLPARSVVRFTAPREVDVVGFDPEPLRSGHLRVRTLYSGISAGTELTAYRGSNVYLRKSWDAGQRLFTDHEGTMTYPLSGWGYSEVGEVVEVADDVENGSAPTVGDVVYGIWGHRSEAVLPASTLAGRCLPPHVDPLHGVFARVGAIALNAVLASAVHLGETLVVFGQGVIGLLATRLAGLSGATVIAVDTVEPRRAMAARLGAHHTIDPTAGGDVAGQVRAHASSQGADVAIELSGSYAALHQAIRSTAVGGTVVAAGFYQGEGAGLNLGEEFHHNRISIVASQIGGLPSGLDGRWSTERLHRVFMDLVAQGRIDLAPLVSRVVPVAEAASAYRVLDENPSQALQVVLDFRASGGHGEGAR